MIDFSSKTFENILSDMLSRVDDGLNKRDGSLIKTSLAAAAWAIEGIYLNLSYLQNQAFPKTAIGENLDYIAATVGLERKDATKAQWYLLSNAPMPDGTRLLYSGSETSYYFDTIGESETIVDPADPNLTYRTMAECDTAGSMANDFTGSLQSIDFVQDLTSVVFDYVAIHGSDEETDESLRTRYFQEVGAVEFGGNISSYQTFIKSIGGVGAVQVYPTWEGPGTVLCSVLSDELVPITNEKIEEIKNIVCPPDADDPDELPELPSENGYGMAPIGAVVTIPTPFARPVSLVVEFIKAQGSTRTDDEIITDMKAGIRGYILQLCSNWEKLSRFNSASYSLIMYYNKVIGILSSVDGVEVIKECMLNGFQTDTVYPQTASERGQKVPTYDESLIDITEVEQ